MNALNSRVKVIIRCNLCGEKFILRGRKEKRENRYGFQTVHLQQRS